MALTPPLSGSLPLIAMSVAGFVKPLIYGAVALIGLWSIRNRLTRSHSTRIRDLHGPPAESYLRGSLPTIRASNNDVAEWSTKYGKTFAVRIFLGIKSLYTLDPRALAYVLSHQNEFKKSSEGRAMVMTITGPGLAAIDGEDHKRQRKMLNPVFSQAQLREYIPLFIQKAGQLKDIWSTEASKHGSNTAEINVTGWLTRATLDVIGQAGFGYDFNSLENEDNELAKAFHGLFSAVGSFNVFELLRVYIPAIANIPTAHNLAFKRHAATLRKTSESILNKNQRLLDRMSESKEGVQGKDILSVLVRSNAFQDDGTGLSRDEVIAQIATFVTAGHETTSTALSWALYALAKAPEVQRKLTQELVAFPHENPSLEDLNSLTYLDWVVRETLRIHTPAELLTRQVQTDEAIPLSTPITDIYGREVTEVHVKKGDTILIHAREINTNKDLWGPDAREFRPERWETPPQAASAIPSVYSNLMTFTAGHRSCIGWRMVVYEMKAFLFVLFRSLVFEIDPDLVISRRLDFAVSRPFIVGRDKADKQLPLKISLYHVA